MHTLDGHRTIEYDRRGNGQEAIFFVPALGADRSMFNQQLVYFESRYLIVAYDATGSAHANQPTLNDYTADLFRVMDAAEVEAAHVVGVSMGGMIGQLAAIVRPTRVLSLTLASSVSEYQIAARQHLIERADTVDRAGMEAVVDTILERWFTTAFRASESRTVFDTREMLLQVDPRAYAQAAVAAAGVETRPHLHKIRCPALIIRGSDDESVSRDSVETIREGICGSELIEIAGCAHLCNAERPDEFNDAVDRLLAKNRVQDRPA